MAEWLKAHAWKACLGETLTRVRIPLSPPVQYQSLTEHVHKYGRHRHEPVIEALQSHRPCSRGVSCSAVAAAAIADATVERIIGTGTETQFRFKGSIDDRKP